MGMSDIEQELRDRGFASTEGERVCLDCITNAHFRQNVENKAADTREPCIGCGRYGLTVEADDILTEMISAVRLLYGYAVDFVPWEGGYVFETTSAREVIRDEFFEDLTDTAMEALSQHVSDESLARDLDRSDDLLHAWDEFERVRVAGEQPVWGSGDAFLHDFDGFLARNPVLLRQETTKQCYWRVRKLDAPKDLADYDSAAQMGSSLPKFASDSRFSTAGSPMFYGAEDATTAVKEVFQGGTTGTAVVAEFDVARPLVLLDLVSLPPSPSIYDHSKTELFLALRFLRNFAQEVSKPVVKTAASKHYAATQRFTAMIQSLSSPKIDGIRYSSSLTGRPCVAIFAVAEHCAEPRAKSPRTMLVYKPSQLRSEAVPI